MRRQPSASRNQRPVSGSLPGLWNDGLLLQLLGEPKMTRRLVAADGVVTGASRQRLVATASSGRATRALRMRLSQTRCWLASLARFRQGIHNHPSGANDEG